MAKITFSDKENLNTLPDVAEINKITAANVNEIKRAVNNTDDELKETNNNLNELRDSIGTSKIPVGTISYCLSEDNIPDGFLLLNGQEISRTEYAELFSIIGTTYGVGDGSTTFDLPNQNAGIEEIEDESLIPNYFYIIKAR